MSPLVRDTALGVVVGLVAMAAFHFGRGYPWPLASVMGLSVGALVFVTGRNIERIRDARQDLSTHSSEDEPDV